MRHEGEEIISWVLGFFVDAALEKAQRKESLINKRLTLWSSQFFDQLIRNQGPIDERKGLIVDDQEAKNLNSKPILKIIPIQSKNSLGDSQFKIKSELNKSRVNLRVKSKGDESKSSTYNEIKSLQLTNSFQKLPGNQKIIKWLRFQKSEKNLVGNQNESYSRALLRATSRKYLSSSESKGNRKQEKQWINPTILQYKVGNQRKVKSKSTLNLPKVTTIHTGKLSQSKQKIFKVIVNKILKKEETGCKDVKPRVQLGGKLRFNRLNGQEGCQFHSNERKLVLFRKKQNVDIIHIPSKEKAKEYFPEMVY